MDPELKQEIGSPERTIETENGESVKMDVNVEQAGTLSKLPPAGQTSGSQTSEQWKEISDKISALLADLPDYVSDFFKEYKRPLVTVGLFVGAIIAVKLTLAVLSAINDIPLLAPTFELIGFGYSAWFIYRYLLRASNRHELSEDFNSLKEQVLGKSFD